MRRLVWNQWEDGNLLLLHPLQKFRTITSPHHNSWIIFWKSWVIFWMLIWTQAGEMASSLNFRFLLCNGGQTLLSFPYLLLYGRHAEAWELFWGTCDAEMRWCPFWPWITGKANVFLGTKDFPMTEKFLECEFPSSASIPSAGSRTHRGSGPRTFSRRYSLENFSV